MAVHSNHKGAAFCCSGEGVAMIVLIDVDQTVLDLVTPWLGAWNRGTGQNVTLADVVEYDISLATGPEIFSYLRSPSLWDAALPVAGAVEAIRDLQTRHQCIFVTSCCPPEQYAWKCLWIQRHGLSSRPSRDVIACRDKWLIAGDVFIDDDPTQINLWRAMHPRPSRTASIRYPYTRGAADFEADSWPELVTYIDGGRQ